jgi:hypothetical protein
MVAIPPFFNIELYVFTSLTIVTLARLRYKLPDDGHRSKHVAAF